MMKNIFLLLIWVLSCNIAFSQTAKEMAQDILEGKQVGDTLIGKHVKYKLDIDNAEAFLVLQNLTNQDTVNLKLISPEGAIELAVPESFKEQIAKIVGEFLTREEIVVYKKTVAMDIQVKCRLKQGKIAELAFGFSRLLLPEDDPELQDEFGRSLVDKYRMERHISADRFYEIEKALIKRLDFSDQEWIEDGIYLNLIIDSTRVN